MLPKISITPFKLKKYLLKEQCVFKGYHTFYHTIIYFFAPHNSHESHNLVRSKNASENLKLNQNLHSSTSVFYGAMA